MKRGRPRKSINLTPEEYLRLNDQYSHEQIAVLVGVSASTLTLWKKENGMLEKAKRWKTNVEKFRPRKVEKLKKQFIDLQNKGYTFEATAKEMGLSRRTLDQFRRLHFPETFRKSPEFFTTKELRKIKKAGITSRIADGRIRLGWKREEALTTPQQKKPFFTKEQNEKIRKSGINRATVYSRVKKGWSFEKAISTPLIVQKGVRK